MSNKTVRIIAASATNHTHETVNIATTGTLSEQYTQAAGVQNPLFKTVQDSGGTIKGLRTIVVPGYVAPA